MFSLKDKFISNYGFERSKPFDILQQSSFSMYLDGCISYEDYICITYGIIMKK